MDRYSGVWHCLGAACTQLLDLCICVHCIMANTDLRKTQVFLIQTGFPAPDEQDLVALDSGGYSGVTRGGRGHLSFHPASLPGLPAEMLSSAVMDSVCYWGRRGPFPTRCVHVSTGWGLGGGGGHDLFPPLPYFMLGCEMEPCGKTQQHL